MSFSNRWWRHSVQIVATLASTAAVTAVYHWIPGINDMTVALTYFALTLAAAVRWGAVEGTAATVACTLGLDYFFEQPRYSLSIDDPEKLLAVMIFLAGTAGASTLAARIRARTEEALQKQRDLAAANADLERARLNSDRLLGNILPGEVARELQSKGAVTPRYYEDATVLFTDFCSFSVSTEKLPAEDLARISHEWPKRDDSRLGIAGWN